MLGVYGIVTAADYGWTSAHTLGFTGAAVGLGALFVLLESRLRNPLMPLRIVGIRSLTGASGARALLFTGLFTNFFVGALYLQHVRGYSAFQTGLAFLPTTLMIGVMSSGIAARLMARVGPRNLLIAGLAIIIAALTILANAGPGTGYAPELLAAYVLLGAGAGSSFLPLLTISMSEVPLKDVLSGVKAARRRFRRGVEVPMTAPCGAVKLPARSACDAGRLNPRLLHVMLLALTRKRLLQGSPHTHGVSV